MVSYKNGGIMLCLAALFLLSAGMSDIVNTSSDNFPVPAKNFAAVIIDRSGVETEVSLLSINGFTFLYGSAGQGKHSIPFEKLQSITFSKKDDKLEATARLTSGKTITIVSEPSQDCYGRTEFGSYTIKLNDIQKIIIKGRIQPVRK